MLYQMEGTTISSVELSAVKEAIRMVFNVPDASNEGAAIDECFLKKDQFADLCEALGWANVENVAKACKANFYGTVMYEGWESLMMERFVGHFKGEVEPFVVRMHKQATKARVKLAEVWEKRKQKKLEEKADEADDVKQQLAELSLEDEGVGELAEVPEFNPCERFQGSRPGQSFKMGDHGLGYYRDDVPQTPARNTVNLEDVRLISSVVSFPEAPESTSRMQADESPHEYRCQKCRTVLFLTGDVDDSGDYAEVILSSGIDRALTLTLTLTLSLTLTVGQ